MASVVGILTAGYFSYCYVVLASQKGPIHYLEWALSNVPAITQFIDSAKTDEIIEIQTHSRAVYKSGRKDP